MDIKQSPFSFYDFLGYLIPGSVFIYGIVIIYGHISTQSSGLEFIVGQLGFERAEIYIPFILTAYTAGHILSYLSSITIEKYAIWAHGYPSKYLLNIPVKGYLDVDSDKILRRFLRMAVWLIMFPISAMDWILGKRMGMRNLYAKPLDEFLITVIRNRIESLINRHAKAPDHSTQDAAIQAEFFRYGYHYAIENAPNHVPRMQNYVALFGFLRTLTLISLLLFWTMAFHAIFYTPDWHMGLGTVSSSGLLSFVLFMSFVKIYRRFSLEALMAMAITLEDRSARPS